MKKLRKNLFLGAIIVISSIVGFFLQQNEQSNYVIEIESNAGENLAGEILGSDSISTIIQDTAESDSKININTASKEQLMKLQGIGEIKAERIIKYRETKHKFEVIEDIMKIEGIGRKTFEKFKEDIKVD